MLNIKTKEFNFGTINYGQIGAHLIEIENPTPSSIVVDSTTSCGCTTGHMLKNPIEPYKTETFKVNFNTKKTGLGSQSKSITIKWNVGSKVYSETVKFTVNVV